MDVLVHESIGVWSLLVGSMACCILIEWAEGLVLIMIMW